MDTIEQYVRSVESRVIGRVFTYDERLHFVLDADRESGLARLSCRYGERTEFIYMPVAEVLFRLEEECRRHAEQYDFVPKRDADGRATSRSGDAV